MCCVLFFVTTLLYICHGLPLDENMQENYGRKMENIERGLSRLQAYVRLQSEKVLVAAEQNYFKGDHIEERLGRKIDATHESLNRRLAHLEQRVELHIIKSQNAIDMVTKKIEKMEEGFTVRDSDMEAEMADAIAAIDDMKTACSSVEENITKAIAKVEKVGKRQHMQITDLIRNVSKNLLGNMSNIRQLSDLAINMNVNTTRTVMLVKAQLLDAYDKSASKVFNMYEDIMEKTHTIGTKRVSNLLVQASNKNIIPCDDSATETEILKQISRKIDSNLETILQTQSLFLESCHKVQIEENELEEKISDILEKILNIFEEKTSISPVDLQRLEHQMRSRNADFHKMFNYVASNLLTMTHKTMNSNNKIEQKLDGVEGEIYSLQQLIDNATVGVQDLCNQFKIRKSMALTEIMLAPNQSRSQIDEYLMEGLGNLIKIINNTNSYYRYHVADSEGEDNYVQLLENEATTEANTHTTNFRTTQHSEEEDI